MSKRFQNVKKMSNVKKSNTQTMEDDMSLSTDFIKHSNDIPRLRHDCSIVM